MGWRYRCVRSRQLPTLSGVLRVARLRGGRRLGEAVCSSDANPRVADRPHLSRFSSCTSAGRGNRLLRVLDLVQKLTYGHVDVVANHSAPAAGLEPPLTIRHAYLNAFVAARELHARISRPRLPVELFPRFGHRCSFQLTAARTELSLSCIRLHSYYAAFATGRPS